MPILSIVGARPQFIKEAIVQRELLDKGIEEILVHTGQHYDANMSDVFFSSLKMREPDYNLNIGSGGHGHMTGLMMIKLEEIMMDRKPEMVLLYGDTNSTLAGALVAAKLKIPIAHVEAGLRQKPKDMPEEINRVLTDHSSSLLFCPSLTGVRNLEQEGITRGVHFVGDVMFDIYLATQADFSTSIAKGLRLQAGKYVVVTMHRDFNVDKKEILTAALESLSTLAKEIEVIFPLHPRTRRRIQEFGLSSHLSALKVIEPIGYLEMMGLVSGAHSVVTDSGGLQKEAYFAGKRAVILMEDSGWRELVDGGWNILAQPADIARSVLDMTSVPYPQGIYGDGHAAGKVVEILEGL